MDSNKSYKLIQDTCDHLVTLPRNQTVLHNVLANMLGVKPRQQTYYQLVIKLKRQLIQDYGVFLATEHKVGYRIVNYGEEIGLCEGEFISGAKRMKRAVVKTNYIRVDELPEAAKSIALEKAQKMSNLMHLFSQKQIAA